MVPNCPFKMRTHLSVFCQVSGLDSDMIKVLENEIANVDRDRWILIRLAGTVGSH